MTRKQYRPWSPDQTFLLPPSPRDWLPDNHLVHFIMEVTGELNISEIERVLESKDPRGERPWNPRMMTALLIYGYCTGVRSSRRLERATYEDVAVRLLSGGCHPDHSVIAEFRRSHLQALSGLFIQVLRLCQKAGMVKLGRVALDGTKVKANASRHKAMSYGRMLRTEEELSEEVATMLKEAESGDAAEDAAHGRDRRGDELPAELNRREDRLKRIRQAREELEKEAKAAREQILAEREARKGAGPTAEDEPTPAVAATADQPQGDESPRTDVASGEEASSKIGAPSDQEPPSPRSSLPSHQVKHTAAGLPKADAQRNFTDPESRIMKSGKDFIQGWNAQVVVDEAWQIIVAAELTNQPADTQHLQAMLSITEANCGARPVQVLGDAGYYSAANVEYCEALGMDVLLSVRQEKHVLDGPTPFPPEDPRAAMHAKLRTTIGRAAYTRRKAIVEPVFGQLKAARGLRQFLLRGLEKVRGEWSLDCMCHNLLKLFRLGQQSALARA